MQSLTDKEKLEKTTECGILDTRRRKEVPFDSTAVEWQNVHNNRQRRSFGALERDGTELTAN